MKEKLKMEEKFINVLKKFAVSDIEITESSHFLNDLGISSLGMFSMVCELEKAYDKKINIMSLINIKTVGQLYKIFAK